MLPCLYQSSVEEHSHSNSDHFPLPQEIKVLLWSEIDHNKGKRYDTEYGKVLLQFHGTESRNHHCLKNKVVLCTEYKCAHPHTDGERTVFRKWFQVKQKLTERKLHWLAFYFLKVLKVGVKQGWDKTTSLASPPQNLNSFASWSKEQDSHFPFPPPLSLFPIFHILYTGFNFCYLLWDCHPMFTYLHNSMQNEFHGI